MAAEKRATKVRRRMTSGHARARDFRASVDEGGKDVGGKTETSDERMLGWLRAVREGAMRW